ncbi:MAG: 1-(5-phosphoribosyl)-5-[(5-phosphoribosylamino)methylideneamino]imidazole-4-carboxamide isomerase [Balneolaceae bacterium]
MRIIPAIDLLGGQVVRLFKGDYNRKKIYSDNPLAQAKIFTDAGFDRIHVVDLDGAKTGRFENLSHIAGMIETLGVSVQTGGGIRSFAHIEQLLNAGVSGVICSSLAVRNPDDWLKALETYPGRCILGMDLKDGKMAYGGWLKTSDQPLEEFLQPMTEAGLTDIVCTDISRDGTLEGPNTTLYSKLSRQFPGLNWIASGGVSSPEDLEELRKIGVAGVIVGKAYYEGKISLKELAGKSGKES